MADFPVVLFFPGTHYFTTDVTGGIEPTLVLEVLTPTIDSAPGGVIVALAGGTPDENVQFEIDGNLVWEGETDSQGGFEPITIPVPDLRDGSNLPILGAGTHTIQAIQAGAVSGSIDFDIHRDPARNPNTDFDDDPPVAVPSRIQSGVHRWVLQDLMPGGLGSWVMPFNPKEWDGAPFAERSLTARVTTAPEGGQFHVYESGVLQPVQRSFSGWCPTEEMREQLEAYGDLNRRFYLFDHRDDVWVVTFTDLQLEPQLVKNWNGEVTAEGHNYKVIASIYNRTPLEAP